MGLNSNASLLHDYNQLCTYNVELNSELELAVNTPYLALAGELWSVLMTV